jgi:hypothetical protein
MLHARRLIGFVLAALLLVPFVGVELFGQAKDNKDKKEPAKTETKKEGSKEKEAPKEKDAGGKIALAWKFKPFYQTMTTTTDQKMKVMSNDVTQKQTQTFYFSWTPIKEEGDKVILEQKILGVKMDIDIGGSPIRYDSTAQGANNANNPLGQFFQALVNSTFTVTLDRKTYKVVDIKGRDEFVKKLVNANKQMQPLLNKILSEEALREMAEPTFAVIPSEGVVETGKTWKKSTTLDMGPIGKYTNEYTYKYEGADATNKNLDKIGVDTKLTYQPPEKAAEGAGGLPFRIKKANLESKNAKGTVLFNREKGRVEKSNTSIELNGTLDIEIGGQLTSVTLSQTQSTEVTSSDTNPVETKPAETKPAGK